VWLTATAISVAGFPFVYCLCPDGHGKVFCPGPSAQAQGCCCGAHDSASSEGGRCCSGPRTALPAKERRSCCQRHHQPANQKPGSHVAPLGCERTLVHVEVVAPEPSGKTPSPDPAVGLSIPLSTLTCSSQIPGAHNCQLSWQSYRIPPPTDLVIVLLQLLI
jgi:hypothetical protein